MIDTGLRRGARPGLAPATVLLAALLVVGLGAATASRAASISLLNVSYDPTREMYEDYNKAFAK